MTSFSAYRNDINTISTIIESIPLSEVTEKDFITAVKGYSNLDDALAELPEDYIEFFLKNMNSGSLNKKLKRLKLSENYDWEQNDLNVGMAPKPDKVKKIHYKGNYLILKFDPVAGWIPAISFRSITQATKYIKRLYDEFN